MPEKFGRSHKNNEASLKRFFEFNPKFQIWQGSFRKYSKEYFKNGKKIKYLTFLRAITFCVKTLRVTVDTGELLRPAISTEPTIIVLRDYFSRKVKNNQNQKFDITKKKHTTNLKSADGSSKIAFPLKRPKVWSSSR